MPGRVCSLSAGAVLTLTEPADFSPSATPWATALASRAASEVAFAVSSRMASGLRLSGVQAVKATRARVKTTARFIQCFDAEGSSVAGQPGFLSGGHCTE